MPFLKRGNTTLLKSKKHATLFLLLLVSAVASADFDLVGNHPYAIQQPDTKTLAGIFRRCVGKTIANLQTYKGRIYASYGDWRCNTGPVELCKINAANNGFICEFSQLTEGVQRFRVLNNKLYSISVDPSPPNQFGHAYAVKSKGAWTSKRAHELSGDINNYPVHAYDMNRFAGDLWYFSDHWTGNSTNDPNGHQHPIAWRSSNNGNIWFDSFSLPQLGVSPRYPVVFCFGEVLNGRLYTQSVQHGCGSPIEAFSRVYNGSSWTSGPSLAPTGKPTRKTGVFAGSIVMIHDSSLFGFDGSATTLKYSPLIYDYTISGNYLYILKQGSMSVCRTRNLATFWCFDTAPLTGRSIAVLNGSVYIGTTKGRVYKAAIPDQFGFGFLPSIHLLLLTN